MMILWIILWVTYECCIWGTEIIGRIFINCESKFCAGIWMPWTWRDISDVFMWFLKEMSEIYLLFVLKNTVYCSLHVGLLQLFGEYCTLWQVEINWNRILLYCVLWNVTPKWIMVIFLDELIYGSYFCIIMIKLEVISFLSKFHSFGLRRYIRFAQPKIGKLLHLNLHNRFSEFEGWRKEYRCRCTIKAIKPTNRWGAT